MKSEKTPFIPYEPVEFSIEEAKKRSEEFFEFMARRRSVRMFSAKPIPEGVLENIIATAGTAPSGAHKQPWVFCLITDKKIKNQIRRAAEEEEKINYESRFTEEWKKDLEPFGTDFVKEYIDIAPALIVLFKQLYHFDENGKKCNHYYVNESVGIAAGMLITAIHYAGLVTLTHTPNPMKFLNQILSRPAHEQAVMLMPVGYPAEGVQVPDLKRKPLQDIMIRF